MNCFTTFYLLLWNHLAPSPIPPCSFFGAVTFGYRFVLCAVP